MQVEGIDIHQKPACADTVAVAVAVKKKPGRPPKKKIDSASVAPRGIVDTPDDPEHSIELSYHNPIMFKKIFTMLKKYFVSEVTLQFDTDGVKIQTNDQLNKSKIFITIDGSCMNHYYCKNPLQLSVKRDLIDRALFIVDRDNHNIDISVGCSEKPNSMKIKIRNIDAAKITIKDIDVTMIDCPHKFEMHDDSTYPLKFTFPSKHFKSDMKNIMKDAPYVSFQKTHEKPLQLSPGKVHGSVTDQIYDDNDKIMLQCTLDPFETLNVSVATAYIQPFSDSCPGDNILIAVDRILPISFSTNMDKQPGLTHEVKWACIVKVFTEVRSLEPQAIVNDVDKKLCEQLAVSKKPTKIGKKR